MGCARPRSPVGDRGGVGGGADGRGAGAGVDGVIVTGGAVWVTVFGGSTDSDHGVTVGEYGGAAAGGAGAWPRRAARKATTPTARSPAPTAPAISVVRRLPRFAAVGTTGF